MAEISKIGFTCIEKEGPAASTGFGLFRVVYFVRQMHLLRPQPLHCDAHQDQKKPLLLAKKFCR